MGSLKSLQVYRRTFQWAKGIFLSCAYIFSRSFKFDRWPTNILSRQIHHSFYIRNVTFLENRILHLIFHWKYAIISAGMGLKNLRVQKNLVQNSGTNSEISAPRTLFIADDFVVCFTDLQYKTIVIGGHLTVIAVHHPRNCQLGW